MMNLNLNIQFAYVIPLSSARRGDLSEMLGYADDAGLSQLFQSLRCFWKHWKLSFVEQRASKLLHCDGYLCSN